MSLKKARIFIGIACDIKAQRQIWELLGRFENSLDNVRWVPPANRHLTLAFLGNITLPAVEDLAHGFDEAYGMDSPFLYRLTRLANFPRPESKIIALTGEPHQQLDGLYQATLGLLRKSDIKTRRERFLPHVTVARSRGRQSNLPILDRVTNVVLEVSEVTLFESKLGKAGSIYSPLKKTRLGR